MKYFFLIRYCFLVCLLAFSFDSFANFDTVNRQSCSCSPKYYWGGWTPYNIYEERQHYLVAYGSGQITWKCSKNASNGCSNPNCSVNSSCSIHNTSCSCSYGGGTPTGTFNRRPRWQCLTSPTVNLTNAHPVSNNELPPSYTLPQNFSFSIVSYTEETSGAANANATKCEYACNLGYVRDTLAGVTQCRLALCLANPAIGANTNNVGPANSYPLAGDELPTSLTFTQDYQTTLRWSIGATQYIVAEIDRSGTGAGCEYTCNAGYIPDGVSSCRLPICLPNTAIGVTANNTAPANASPISSLELPSSLTLVRDYTTQLISDPNRRTELNTAAGCEYTCNDGFKIGPKTAAAESNSTGTFAKITHGGGGYTTPPTVQVTGGTCTTLPTAVATINSSGSVDSITLNGAVNCTIAPTLTIGAPTDTMSRCIATQCLGFAKPLNATYCSGDTTLAGHDDGLNVRRADSSGCTSNAKCEWYCPAATPFYCESSNTCVASQNECGQTNTCKTSAPSELKTETDLPLIQCDAINATSTHFRYKIEKTSGLGVTSASTSTNPNLTVIKLLAKADAGRNCPANASAYVPNLTDIVANDKVCVRLVYNNATTGAVSNALITDSIPTGFTRVANSTKNCLTPTGSSELCSDASGMGGAIGNNGWSGNNFSLTPHAGFYAIPATQSISATMEKGTKRYLINCTVPSSNIEGTQITHTHVTGAVNINPGFTSKENNWSQTLNPQPTNAQCASLINHSGIFWNNTDFGYQPSQVDILGRKHLLNCNLSTANIAGYNYNVYLPMVAVNSDPGFTNHTTNYGPVTPQGTNAQCANLAAYPYASLVYNNTSSSGQPGQIDLTEGRYLVSCMWNGYNNVQYLSHRTVNSNPGFTSKENNWSNTLNPQPTNTQCATLVGHSTGGEFINTGGGRQPYQTDLLDTTNGKGYIQYMVEATATPSNLALPNVTLVGTTTTAEISRANATINSQSSVSGNGDPYISPLFTVGTAVKHPTTFYAGTYTVTCLYGTAANTNNTLPDYGMTPDTTCNKTMTVKDDANGCSRIYPYRGSTLSNEMSSPSAFDASFRCGSRQTVTNTADTKAYRLQIGTGDPAFLAYDRTITDLFAGLAIGPVSTQTQNYNFTSGTDVSCAAKVGDGYSTNPSCQLRTCTGSSCANPQTFIVVPSEEITCTNQDSISYDVGCNPASPDYTQCLQWIYAGTPTSGNTYTRNAKIKVNNVEQDIYFQCKIDTPEGALGPVKTCTIQLPTGGMPVTIFAGDANTTNNSTNYSFQTTAYTLKKDTGKPVGSIAYYTNYSNGVTLSQDQYDYWQKQPITAVITCTDKASTTATGEPTTNGETDGPGCACATTLTNLTNTTPTATEQAEIDQWSLGLPSTNTNIGPDIMTYSRVITNNKGALVSLKVQDTAGNKSTNPLTANFGIDSTEPKLVATKTSNSVTLAFTETHGGASGFWKPLSAFGDTLPAGVLRGKSANNSAILYRVGPKSQLATLEFGEKCAPMPDVQTVYFKYSETSSAPTTQTLTLPSFDVNNNIVAYCVQDNAGNINRGYYPNNLTGCFSSSAMPTIPTLSPSTLASHYAPFLKTKLTSTTLSNNEKYGYSFSENPTNASCFRGILSTNITTLVTNQLNPRPAGEITLDNWTTKLSTIKNTTTPNGNGYYYYDLGTTTNNTLTITAPTGTGTKSVIVDGGNIQINSNIEYTGTGKTLLLIARKNSAGQGGNIYINPTVTRVDAIIIADGGSLMNGTTTNGTTTTKNWITNATDLTNRLTINGRVYSYNTRGGSITPQATPGTDFDPITTNIGKYFDTTSATTPLIATGTPTQAATYDLERLRVMLSDGNSQCTTHVNYQAFTTGNLPTLLIKPSGFAGGSCSF